MSPEQTGRMNRDVDYRTDFYSLGVTLYEMLTGKLPFESADPLEVVHCHIARVPLAPSALDGAIPGPLSDIVMKLLAKTAEDRYQSGFGLREDLARCLAEWEATGRIEGVVAGRTDLADRFLIPQRLYGRDGEVATLLAAFERASGGGAELLLVSGYSGIGKTSLIHEVHKSLTHRRRRFIPGQFEQGPHAGASAGDLPRRSAVGRLGDPGAAAHAPRRHRPQGVAGYWRVPGQRGRRPAPVDAHSGRDPRRRHARTGEHPGPTAARAPHGVRRRHAPYRRRPGPAAAGPRA